MNNIFNKYKILLIDDDQVHISIGDNRKGVSEEELNNIFERYYRGTNTSKKIEGSGLGMAIAHDIIKVHGADITATSQLGQGIRIDITLLSCVEDERLTIPSSRIFGDRII